MYCTCPKLPKCTVKYLKVAKSIKYTCFLIILTEVLKKFVKFEKDVIAKFVYIVYMFIIKFIP